MINYWIQKGNWETGKIGCHPCNGMSDKVCLPLDKLDQIVWIEGEYVCTLLNDDTKLKKILGHTIDLIYN